MSSEKTTWKTGLLYPALGPALGTLLSGVISIVQAKLQSAQWTTPPPHVLAVGGVGGFVVGVFVFIWRRRAKSERDQLPELMVSRITSSARRRRGWAVAGYYENKMGWWRVVRPPLTFADVYAIGGTYGAPDPEQYEVLTPPFCLGCCTELDEVPKGNGYLWTCPDPNCGSKVESEVSQEKMAEQVGSVVRRDARQGRPLIAKATPRGRR